MRDESIPKMTNTKKLAPVILLVDDDEFVLKTTSRLLKAYEMEVHGACSGDDALVKIADGLTPNFLISDFRLPHYDGFELVQRARDVLKYDIPTVIMTGDKSMLKTKQSPPSNITVLDKPIDFERLLKLIDESTSAATGEK